MTTGRHLSTVEWCDAPTSSEPDTDPANTDRLREAVDAEAAALAEVTTHADAIDAVSEAIAGIDEHLDVVRQLRWDAVRALRAQGWSFDRISMRRRCPRPAYVSWMLRRANGLPATPNKTPTPSTRTS